MTSLCVVLLLCAPGCKRKDPSVQPAAGVTLPPPPLAPRPRATPKVDTTVAPGAPTGGPPWREVLSKEAGEEPVFLTLLAGDSVIARTPSGGVSRKLVTGGVDEALWDPRGAILFIGRDGRIEALALGEPQQVPVTLVTGVPEGLRFGVERVGGEGTRMMEERQPCPASSRLVIRWDSEPNLVADGGAGGDAADRWPGVRLVGGAWLASRLGRSSGAKVNALEFTGAGAHGITALPRSAARCEGTAGCGKAVDVGIANWQLVMVRAEGEGDCPELGCLVLDTKGKRWSTPPLAEVWSRTPQGIEPGPCGRYLAHPDRASFLLGERVCQLSEGAVTCAAIEGAGLGWLDGGVLAGTSG